MYKLLIFLATILLIFISCTPTEANEQIELQFYNGTEYRDYYNPNHALVNVHSVYTAKVYRNGVLISDSDRYVNNALYFRNKNNSADADWKFIKSFGADSLAVTYRKQDTIFVRYQDSLSYCLVKTDYTPSLPDTVHTAYHDLLPHLEVSPEDIIRIDATGPANKYTSYAKWKETVTKKYL